MQQMRDMANRAMSAALDTEEPQKEIGDKMSNIEEYKAATKPAPTPAAPVQAEPSMKDKINPKARFGARAGEKRIDTEEMRRPLGSFEKGTDNVPKTGVYKLHKGEAVISKDKNPMHTDKMKAALSDEDKSKPKKTIKHIKTRKTHDGKFVHTHEHHHPSVHPDEEHVSNNMAELKKHMEAHMGGEPDGDEAAGAQAGPAQMTAAPPAMPAAPAAGAGPMPQAGM